jgi:hypothetical protein
VITTLGVDMAAREKLYQLIAVNAPLWAGEAEVFRVYWDSTVRTRETDLLWLLRQSYKELEDGFLPVFRKLDDALRETEHPIEGNDLVEAAALMLQEAKHYCAFAAAYESLRREGDPPLTLALVRRVGNWPENDALCRLRREHERAHGELGRRARLFTEGGYCTLYCEGMKLGGRDRVGDVIAAACARVYEDEIDHMLKGIAGLEHERLSAADWDLLADLTGEQMRSRIRMRNAQFSYPLREERVAELCRGESEPLSFDYARAGLPPPC